ncbi:hypothetical protein DICPUDRAFT_93443 [Dictyostelium purpureum]|uniref:Histone acetyltransferase type B catalytic subunit n=1 Tax=Dictyostelium purpureum TaxID=5786 RepID=F0Z7I5_DICPU|nr:uncharacterized protein DICPUDRAFT_93443 [Dictyostelium purpureum]EGC40025.1 hypothetical protein DICPUDRAFT_93443 [Dictyostelium purpureum]|eukprot:XP_003283374.1 hypothetical protein DICPUDRAFT_93443 [Dictyostelium purpureum]
MSIKLKPLSFNATESTNLKLVWNLDDIKEINELENDSSFHPVYSHQIFGEEETIVGYDPLRFNVLFGAGSLISHIDTNYTLNSNNITNVEGELLKIFSKQDPPISKESFYKYIEEKEKLFRPPGKKIYEYTVTDKETGRERDFEVYYGSLSDPQIEKYHERMQIFVLWFIDGSSYVFVEPNWDLFITFEKRKMDGETRYGLTGYCTVYNFYHHPSQTRERVSQFLILPPYQKMGHGSKLLNSIYNYYKNNDGLYGPVYDVTVEDPADEFNALRNYVDLKNILDDKLFDNVKLDLNANNTEVFEKIRKSLLIPHKQSKLCLEIFMFSKFISTPVSDPKFKQFRISIKKRLYKQNIGDSEQIDKMKQQVINSKNEQQQQQQQQQQQGDQQQQNDEEVEEAAAFYYNKRDQNKLPTPPQPPTTPSQDKERLDIEKERVETILELYKELEENYFNTLKSLSLA